MTQSPERSEIRAATFLAFQVRFDARRKTSGKVKCNPPNRPCRGRCIPPNWNCRVTGEGTDGHSRVVAGDPLAGVASIARGRDRLAKGLKTGNIADIQGGRAAIARGVVKTVPGRNLKQKQDLRRRVEGAILPVATGLFAAWAIRKGHEATKELFPQYAKGPAQDIENAAGTAVGFIFDRIPFYGAQRQATRRRAAVQTVALTRATQIGYQQSPDIPSNNNNTLAELANRSVSERTITIPQLRDALSSNLDIKQPEGKAPKSYNQFRSDVLSGVTGATDKGRSIYAETAAATFMAKQHQIKLETLKGSDNATKKKYIVQQVNEKLKQASDSMRRDMDVRGLSFTKPSDVELYVKIASSTARRQISTLPEADQRAIVDQVGGTVRDLVSPRPNRRNFTNIASSMYDNTVKSYDEYFQDTASQVKDDTNPARQVGAAAYGNSPIKSVLIGTAEVVKTKVGINSPIAGASHAELVLQKVYHEYSVPGKRYKRESKSTWIATDSDIKYAAQDLGWDNTGGVASAHAFLQRTGQFPRLARRPNDPPAATFGKPAPPSTGKRRSARPSPRKSRDEIIATYVAAGYSPEAAANAADRMIAERKDADSYFDGLHRASVFLEMRRRLS